MHVHHEQTSRLGSWSTHRPHFELDYPCSPCSESRRPRQGVPNGIIRECPSGGLDYAIDIVQRFVHFTILEWFYLEQSFDVLKPGSDDVCVLRLAGVEVCNTKPEDP